MKDETNTEPVDKPQVAVGSTDWMDALRAAFNEGYDKGYHDGRWVECPQDAYRAWDESGTRQNTKESASIDSR